MGGDTTPLSLNSRLPLQNLDPCNQCLEPVTGDIDFFLALFLNLEKEIKQPTAQVFLLRSVSDSIQHPVRWELLLEIQKMYILNSTIAAQLLHSVLTPGEKRLQVLFWQPGQVWEHAYRYWQ